MPFNCYRNSYCMNIPKIKCNYRLTSGPLHEHITTRSMFASAQNSNNFPVNIKLIVMRENKDTKVLEPWYEKEIVAEPCSFIRFNPFDANVVVDSSYQIFWEFTIPKGKVNVGCPVCDKVFVYFASRTDLPTEPVVNSNINREILHADFVPYSSYCNFR